ncbi:MAG TPA: glycosyl hydrolase family protein, partial [Solirubrobacteraceae bacterium]
GTADPAGVSFSLSPSWTALVRRLALAADARLVLGINLESGSWAVSVAEARALLSRIGGTRIEALEVGNEPEAYWLHMYGEENGHVVQGRPAGYDFSQYVREFSQMHEMVGRIPLAGPATGSTSWLANLPQLIATEPTLREVTFHHYPLSRCVKDRGSPLYPTVTNLLSGAGSRRLLAGLARYATIAHRRGILFRVDELNSVTCHGQTGVSDTFASALWILDTLFQMARSGVDAVNIHTWPGAVPGELFTFQRVHGHWTGAVRPLYYGALMFIRSAPPASRLLRTGVAGSAPVHVWAVRWPDGSTHVVAINDSLTRSYTVLVRIGEQSGTGRLERLSAPSASATGGVTIAGQRFRAATATGSLVGGWQSAAATPVNGAYAVSVPAASAASLSLGS